MSPRSRTTQPLEELLQDCTVRILAAEFRSGEPPIDQTSWGTGFFVAPGLILTCAHVVGQCKRVTVIRSQHDDVSGPSNDSIDGHVEQVLDWGTKSIPRLDARYPDLALVKIDDTNHPCVKLDPDHKPANREPFFSSGYPKEGGAIVQTPTSLTLAGYKVEANESFLDFQDGMAKDGFSGAALVSNEVHAVVGVMAAARSDRQNDGGLGIPLDSVKGDLQPILAKNAAFHESDKRWSNAVPRRQESARRLVLLAGIVCVVLALVVWQSRDSGSEWGDVRPNELVVVLADLDPATPEAAGVAEALSAQIEEQLDAASSGELAGVEFAIIRAGTSLDQGSVSEWVSQAEGRIDVVLYGSVRQVAGSATNFSVDWYIFANSRSVAAELPLGIDESLGLSELSVNQATLDAGLPVATTEAALGLSSAVLALAADEPRLAADRLKAARSRYQRATGESGDTILMSSLAAFIEVVAAGQSADPTRIGAAHDELSAALDVDRLGDGIGNVPSEFARSTFLTTLYLSAFERPDIEQFPMCNVGGPPELAINAESISALLVLLEPLADESAPAGVSNANALTLLGRVRLLAALQGGDVAVAAITEPFETIISRYGGPTPEAANLGLWVSDAHAFLGILQRGVTPLDSLVSLEEARDSATPFYNAVYAAEIGHVLQCDLSRVQAHNELASEAASCYYQLALGIMPEGHDDLTAAIQQRVDETGECTSSPSTGPEAVALCYLAGVAETNPRIERFSKVTEDRTPGPHPSCDDL